jgi:hypothetical protein
VLIPVVPATSTSVPTVVPAITIPVPIAITNF